VGLLEFASEKFGSKWNQLLIRKPRVAV
jgi:hypothetical protein